MNLWAPMILAAVFAVWYYIRNPNAQNPTRPNLPVVLPQGGYSNATPDSGGVPFGAPAVAVMAGPSGSPDAAVTVQPSAAASGVPQFTPQSLSVGNPNPGPSTSLQPFYGMNRDMLIPANFMRYNRPYNLPGANGMQNGGCGGGCGGCNAGCGSKPAGGCPSSPSGNRAGPMPTQPINLPNMEVLANSYPSPLTLAGALKNALTSDFTSGVNVYNYLAMIAQENLGDVPAGQTYFR